MLTEPFHPLSATPQRSQLTCPRLCCQHQPEPVSLWQRPHQPPCLAGMRTFSLPPPVVYEDAKSSLRLACAAFPEKKRLTLIPARDFRYFNHTGQNGGNILALGKEENEQGNSYLFLPPLITNPSFSDLMSTERCYSKNFMDSSESCSQLSGDKS